MGVCCLSIFCLWYSPTSLCLHCLGKQNFECQITIELANTNDTKSGFSVPLSSSSESHEIMRHIGLLICAVRCCSEDHRSSNFRPLFVMWNVTMYLWKTIWLTFWIIWFNLEKKTTITSLFALELHCAWVFYCVL